MIGYVKTECVFFVYDDEMVEFYAEIVKNMVLEAYHTRDKEDDV